MPINRSRPSRSDGPTIPCCEPLESRRLLSVDLLANIHAGATPSSFPSGYAEAGGRAWFIAENESFETLLYKTDGTAAGTVAVGPALRRGAVGSLLYTAGPTTVGNAVVYEFNGGGAGTWRLMAARAGDTGPGTELLRSMGDTNLTFLAPAFGGALFSIWNAGNQGTEPRGLYYTDGTAAGTRRIAGIGAAGSAATLGGYVYFVGETNAGYDKALWRTDGTAAGTTRVVDMGWRITVPPQVITFRDRVYFRYSEGASTSKDGLWATDGTPAGTYRVGQATVKYAITATADHLYWSGGVGIWSSDGSPDSAKIIASGPINAFHATSDRLYYAAETPGAGMELWSTRGTAESTTMVADVSPGTFGSRPFELTPLGDRLYFLADAAENDLRLWSTDGTPAGTRAVHDLFPGVQDAAAAASLRNMFSQGKPVMNAALGRVFFPADTGATGLEPWSTDGTPGGAAPLGDFNRADGGSNPADFVAGPGGTFFFGATNTRGEKEVWASDGTPAGTRPFFDPAAGPAPVSGTPGAYLNGQLFVTGMGIWATDGTAAGTRRLDLSASSPVVFNNAVYFVSHHTGNRLMRTDGTVEGTIEVGVNHFYSELQVTPDNPILYPTPLANRLLFQRNFVGSGGMSMALFSTDGTAAGTIPLLTHTDQRQLLHAAVMGGKAYFANDGGRALWVTDGTPEGTRKVADTRYLTSITAAGDRLFYVSDGALWVSDGTTDGTRQVGTTVPTPGTTDEAVMTAFGRNVVFESAGRAWISDGTPEGTRRLWDETVVKLPDSRDTRPFAVWQGRLYFFVSRASNRTALVRSDGTPEGTVAEAELPAMTGTTGTPGPNSTLHAVGDHLVAVPRDARLGREPFVVGQPAPLTPGVAGRHVFYNGSTFDFGWSTPGVLDDDAIAPDKRAALPGDPLTFANLTSYSRGLNGIMIDVRALPGAPITAADFTFRVTTAGSSEWSALPAQPTVSVRRGAGVDRTDRVTLTWPDGAVRNAWLEVTLLPTPRTGLTAPDTFIFGNLVGETGPGPAVARVDATDVVNVRAARTTPGVVVGMANRFDVSRDGVVNLLDETLVRRNVVRSLPVPAPTPARIAAAPPRSATRRSAYDQLSHEDPNG